MVVFAGREHDGEPHEHAPQHEGWHPYGMFAVNMLLSLVVMDLVMLSMIDGWGDFRNNLSMFYMALTMVAPLGIIVRGMYRSKALKATGRDVA